MAGLSEVARQRVTSPDVAVRAAPQNALQAGIWISCDDSTDQRGAGPCAFDCARAGISGGALHNRCEGVVVRGGVARKVQVEGLCRGSGVNGLNQGSSGVLTPVCSPQTSKLSRRWAPGVEEKSEHQEIKACRRVAAGGGASHHGAIRGLVCVGGGMGGEGRGGEGRGGEGEGGVEDPCSRGEIGKKQTWIVPHRRIHQVPRRPPTRVPSRS